MNEMDRPEAEQGMPERDELTQAERRLLLEKRIRELRRKKRQQKRRAARTPRIIAAAFMALFLLAFVLTGVCNLAACGEEEAYVLGELPASNLQELTEMELAAGGISLPAVCSSAAILVDAETGETLYEHNADEERAMASTTKVMTALVVLESSSLQERVTVSERAAATGESSAWLDAGEVLSVEQLLYALMLQSGNDAAVALAEHVGGSESGFVEMMNRAAGEMGLEHTSFANPHGLDAPGHYTSARDLAAVAVRAMAISEFRKIVSTQSYEIPWPGHPFPRTMENHNKLLKLYPGATGMKTGYTGRSGKCLVGAAQQEGRELVTVILDGGDSYWDQTISLMEYGFHCFTRVHYAYGSQEVAGVEVGDFPRREVGLVGAGDLVFTVRRDRLGDYRSATFAHLQWVPYPVEVGQELGYMTIAAGTPRETRRALVSRESRCRPNVFARSFSFVGAVFGQWWRGVKWLIPGV